MTNIFDIIRKGLSLLKKSDLMKDSVIVGLVSGLMGGIAIELFNVVSGKRLLFGKLASSMVVNPFRSYQRKNILIGELMHLTTGATVGTIIVEFIKRTGKEYMMVKSIFVSLLAWIGLHNLGDRFDIFTNKTRTTKSHFIAFLQHVVYGVITSSAINYFANPVIFQQPSNRQNIKETLYNTPQFIPTELESEDTNAQVIH
jgi:hypothetical protein